MHKLAHSDAGRIAIAADAKCLQLVVGHQGAGADRGHAPMQGIKPMGHPQKIGRRLARAANAAQLDYFVRANIKIVGHLDDLAGNRIVPAALA